MTQIWEKIFPIKKSEESHLHIAHWKRENLSSVFFHLYIHFLQNLTIYTQFLLFTKIKLYFQKEVPDFQGIFLAHTGTAVQGS